MATSPHPGWSAFLARHRNPDEDCVAAVAANVFKDGHALRRPILGEQELVHAL